jgi:hypothetical protein
MKQMACHVSANAYLGGRNTLKNKVIEVIFSGEKKDVYVKPLSAVWYRFDASRAKALFGFVKSNVADVRHRRQRRNHHKKCAA